MVYFGNPADAGSYFASVGRPFPTDQPDPADAMLALCSRPDSFALPSLFRRSPFAEDHLLYGTVSASAMMAAAGTARLSAGRGGGRGPPESHGIAAAARFGRSSSGMSNGGRMWYYGGRRRAVVDGESDESEAEPGVFGQGGGGLGCSRCLGGGGGGGEDGRDRPAGFLVQTEALSRRLLLRAVRHPLLLMLHFGGSLVMAACLGTVFEGQLDFTLDGAQSRCERSGRRGGRRSYWPRAVPRAGSPCSGRFASQADHAGVGPFFFFFLLSLSSVWA